MSDKTILSLFEFDHLPSGVHATMRPFYETARGLVDVMPGSIAREACLRELLKLQGQARQIIERPIEAADTVPHGDE